MSTTNDAIILRFFHYFPNTPAAIVALVAFLLAALVSTALNIKTRTWFMFIVTFTALLEAAGYVSRLYMLQKPSMGAFVAMQGLLVISPTFLAVADYMIVGRLLRLAAVQRVVFLRPRQIAAVFAASDVFTLMVQSSGAAFVVSTDEGSRKMGNSLILAGLVLQLGFFAMFTAITIRLHTGKAFDLINRPGAKKMFWCLYTSIALLAVRNVYRVIEFGQGYDGYLAVREGYFYALDTILVLACIIVLTVLHPGFLLPKMAEQQLPSSNAVAMAPLAAGARVTVTVVNGADNKHSITAN